MDKIDLLILQSLQENSAAAVEDIARKVHLSLTPTWRRIQKLEEAGVIEKRVALCNAEKLNVGVTVFVTVKTAQHNAAWLQKFANGVRELPEVMEFYRMSGDVDYLLKVVVPDIAGYDAFYMRLIAVAELSDVSSSFAMERIKYSTALPVAHVLRKK